MCFGGGGGGSSAPPPAPPPPKDTPAPPGPDANQRFQQIRAGLKDVQGGTIIDSSTDEGKTTVLGATS